MIYIWDTNILIHAVRKPLFLETLSEQYDFSNPLNKSYISAVTIGEVRSLAIRNRWGRRRKELVEELIQSLEIVPVTEDPDLIQMYAEIDVYSQSHHPTLRLPTSARKMGKNDLWIAATTTIYNGVLLSTDNDFEHLDGVFFPFEKIVV